MEVEQIARICHEANRIYSEEARTGDHHLPWGHAPQWQRDSAIAGVQALFDDPRRTPEEMHVLWYEHKVADGWVYGPQKDDKAKTHPCLLAYSSLPEAQRAKDFLFTNIVRALMPASHLTAKMGVYAAQDHLDEVVRRDAPVPKFLSDADVKDLLARHNIDPDKPFDPSAPVIVKGPPSDAEPITTEEVKQQLAASQPEQETTIGQEHAEDLPAGEAAQADRNGHQGAGEEGVVVEKPVAP